MKTKSKEEWSKTTSWACNNIPFSGGKFAPSLHSLDQFRERLMQERSKFKHVIEFGAGISSYVIYHALLPETYIACENPQFSASVRKHIPQIKLIEQWEEIPKIRYDFIFVDSHVGGPPHIEQNGRLRHKPVEYLVNNGMVHPETMLVLHDFEKYKKSIFHDPAVPGKKTSWKEQYEQQGWKWTGEILQFRHQYGWLKRKPLSNAPRKRKQNPQPKPSINLFMMMNQNKRLKH